MNFKKMHGLGNDFVILDQTQVRGMLTNAQIIHICDRNLGVGCDLLTVLEPSNKADIFARFYNADASESAACGNATRCVADIIMRENNTESCIIETGRGLLPCARSHNDMVTVDMGAALSIEEISTPNPQLPNPITLDMGNPHCVFFVDDLNAINPRELGPLIENNTDLFPKRTNVEFVEQLSDTKFRQITWERGVGITLACGSGACAVAAAAHHKGLINNTAEIILDGGSLFIEIADNDHILMTGPVAYVFDGKL